MKIILIYLVLVLGSNMVIADSTHMKEDAVRKMRQSTSNNQTSSAADTLNLPANATSIRENITDTFSCENRTYGYYADVDNDCQIFHVCVPNPRKSNHSKAQNSTRRYSFICPKETIFDQETLVCARPIDALDCEDAPDYYYKNLKFGNVNNTKQQNNTQNQMMHYKNDVKKRNLDLKTIIFNPVKSIEVEEHTKNTARETKEENKATDDFGKVLDVNSSNKHEELRVYDTKINKRTSRNKKERKSNRSIQVSI